jgi:hypothetical protein
VKTKTFVIAVDEEDAGKVEAFLLSMQTKKELRFPGSSVKIAESKISHYRSIKLLFAYPTDETGRCLQHQNEEE